MTRTAIVIPTFREAENIAPLVVQILEHVPNARLFVIDDTPDLSTVEAVTPLLGPDVELLHRERRDGRGSAVMEGMRRGLVDPECRFFVELDADFSHSPIQLPELLAELQSRNADLLIASRYVPGGRIENWPLSRRIFSVCANVLARTLLAVPVRDYTGGYRLYSRRGAEAMVETCGRLGRGFIPLSETLVNLYYRGYRIAEAATVFVNRERGVSSLSFREVKDAFFGLFAIYGLKRRLARERPVPGAG